MKTHTFRFYPPLCGTKLQGGWCSTSYAIPPPPPQRDTEQAHDFLSQIAPYEIVLAELGVQPEPPSLIYLCVLLGRHRDNICIFMINNPDRPRAHLLTSIMARLMSVCKVPLKWEGHRPAVWAGWHTRTIAKTLRLLHKGVVLHVISEDLSR